MHLPGLDAECTPQPGLPLLVSAGLPTQHHLRALDQVLVEQVRDAPGELEEEEIRSIPGQVAPQGGEGVIPEVPGQLAQDAPQECLPVEKLGLGGVRKPGLE